jgi:hypothetical protein
VHCRRPGFGRLLALEQISSGSDASQLGAPLTASYLPILGVRIAFEIPASVPSNWIFRSALNPQSNPTIAATCLVVLSFLVPAALAPAFVLAWRQWGIGGAIIHAWRVPALALCRSDLLLAGYRKIPLTCAMPGFRGNLLALCVIQIVGFALFTQFGASLERWMFLSPWRLLPIPLAGSAASRLRPRHEGAEGAPFRNRRRAAEARKAGELDESLTFENIQAPAVERLDLFDADR